MLRGERISLRPIKQADLDELYDHHVEIATRGSFYPLGVMSETTFRKRFDDNGFWDREEGTLVIVDGDARIVGEIEFFRAGTYWDAYELAYHLYDPTAAGKGYTTEAVQLLADYLFANKARHRLQLIILPDNAASRRIAEKCGFQLDGTIRQPFFHGGENVDVLMYSLLRTDPRPWRESATPGA